VVVAGPGLVAARSGAGLGHPGRSGARPSADAVVRPSPGPGEHRGLRRLARIGTTADAARLDAAVRELGEAIDLTQSHGNTLRSAVRRRRLAGTALSEEDWAGDPTARRWWKALTLRFGVPAECEVTRLGANVVHAEIRAGERVLSWAIEAEPADAVAFAALAATGVEQARQAGVAVTGEPFHLNGAAPVPDRPRTEWATRDWHWPRTCGAGKKRCRPTW